MKKRLLSLSLYAIFWLVFFFFARLFFLVFQYKSSAGESFGGLAGTFSHGIMLDISTMGYYLLLPFILMLPALFFEGKWYPVIIRLYTYLLLVFSSLIVVADASLYTYWGFRMDYTPVFYLKTPGEAVASVSTLKLILLLSAVILIASLFIWIYNKFIHSHFTGFTRIKALIPGILVFLLLTGALIIPVRGGVGIAPINAGTVYFSDRMFLNHSAINPVWNVGTTAFTQKPVENPYRFFEAQKAEELFKTVAGDTCIPEKVLNTDRPNILILILESFSSYLVGVNDGNPLVTPRLNSVADDGILFKKFYASGTRTDKAMPAILSGYPAQPAQSVIKEPKKSQSLPNLVRILSGNGYHSAFWYGGEINFANFNSYIIGSGFNTVITQDNFDPENFNSKWGVHDHILFEALKDSMKAVSEPFINVVLTLSSHEPYEVPMKPVFPAEQDRAEYLNSVFYTDSVVGAFLDWGKMQEWWKNTLVVLVADHGARHTEEIPAFAQMVFRIPMLWTGGALEQRGIVVEKIGSQTDIPLTILNQLGLESQFPFSKDLLCSDTPSFAFYTFNEGFGMITDSSSVAYDHKPGKVVWTEGKNPDRAAETGKAYLQMLFDDYIAR